MAEKKFSELETAANLDGSEYAAVSQSQNGVLTSVKATLQAIANWVASGSRYASALNTQDKTLTGAINEVLADAGSDVSVTNTIPSSDETKRVATVTIDGTPTDINADDTEAILRRVFGEHTVEGNPVTFDAYLGLETVKSLTLTMNPIQEGTGDPSPTNIRPISGWDSVDVVVTGKNLFDIETITAKRYVNGNGELSVSDGWSASDYIPIVGNTNIVISGITNTGTVAQHAFYDSTKTFISSINPTVMSFTTPSNTRYIRISMRSENPTSVQVEYGQTATAFVPYETPETHTATFPSTIYGGTAEVVGGVGQSNMGMVDLGSLNWSYSASGYFTSNAITGIKTPATQDDMINAICSQYKQDTARRVYSGYSGDGCFAIRYGTGSLWVRDSQYTDAETFKTAMSGVQLCYELATPTEITLTAEQIELLKGTNVVSSDADDLELKYSVG